MSGIGTGYDLSSSTYSPDGRVFQVEYAQKAVDNSGTIVAIKVKDGIVFGVEKQVISPLLVEGSSSRIFTVGRRVGMAVAGVMADARSLVNRARKESSEYKSLYLDPIPTKVLNERVSNFVQFYTLFSHLRPFGCSALLGGYDERDGAKLYMIEPSGVSWGYYGCAIGKNKSAAKTEIEKLKLENLTCRQALLEVSKILHGVHDDIKEKDFELELSWLCEESKWEHRKVPKDLWKEANEVGLKHKKELLGENDMDDDKN
eukprot:TRINITY_DN17160_c0_g1_i1.p1 TRINITY_DN17160_c0_g1~~TRINITY_DN17160_c0_g1_i1.p1  ORF type:complete len:259 (+),score=83.44 TRINITY_DN17160_c0_g1_i1:203-979(+)